MSEFIKALIRKELGKLYAECALYRSMLQDSRTCWWEPEKYWQNCKAKTIYEGKLKIRLAENALKKHIDDHSSIMGEEWVNLPQRLCWDRYRGGLPIKPHYCNLPEGHAGYHQDDEGAWHRKNKHKPEKPPKRIPARRKWEMKHNLPLP